MKLPAIRIVFAPTKGWRADGYPDGWQGESLHGKRTVRIDPRASFPHHTLLHELIHLEKPAWSETRVKKETARRWRTMNWKQKADLLRLLGRAK